MTPSRMMTTGERQAVRARVTIGPAGEPALELTGLDRRDAGYLADNARVSVPLDQVDELISIIGAVRAAELAERARAANRPRLQPAARPKPTTAPKRRYQGEF